MLVNYKSYVCSKLGKVDSLRIECFNRTKLKRGHVRVRIYAIGLNYVDYLMIKGNYQYKNNLPFIPGTEASGIIIEENCNNRKLINKRVIINSKSGCFSEEISLSFKEIILIDKRNTLNNLEASSFYMASLTSYISLKETIKLKKGDSILISGASGNIGQACIQLAKFLEANVISIVSNQQKKKLVDSLGSDYILKKDENIYKKLMKITNNMGVDVVLDINGFLKEYNLLKAIKWNGKFLIIGFTDGNITSIKTNYILIKGLKIFGIRAGEYIRQATKAKKSIINKNIFKLLEHRVGIPKNFIILGFNDLKKGLKLIKNRTAFGKVIIKTKFYKEY